MCCALCTFKSFRRDIDEAVYFIKLTFDLWIYKRNDSLKYMSDSRVFYCRRWNAFLKQLKTVSSEYYYSFCNSCADFMIFTIFPIFASISISFCRRRPILRISILDVKFTRFLNNNRSDAHFFPSLLISSPPIESFSPSSKIFKTPFNTYTNRYASHSAISILNFRNAAFKFYRKKSFCVNNFHHYFIKKKKHISRRIFAQHQKYLKEKTKQKLLKTGKRRNFCPKQSIKPIATPRRKKNCC